MRPIRLEYTLDVTDYRQAVYFGNIRRRRYTVFVMVVIVGGTALYVAGSAMGFYGITWLPLYLSIAYMVWMLFLMGRLEMSIMRYLKSDQHLLGTPIKMVVTDREMTIEIPKRDIHYAFPLEALFTVFETSRMFNIYITHDKTILLPHRAITPDVRVQLRSIFREKIKGRFITRFGGEANAEFGRRNNRLFK